MSCGVRATFVFGAVADVEAAPGSLVCDVLRYLVQVGVRALPALCSRHSALGLLCWVLAQEGAPPS